VKEGGGKRKKKKNAFACAEKILRALPITHQREKKKKKRRKKKRRWGFRGGLPSKEKAVAPKIVAHPSGGSSKKRAKNP